MIELQNISKILQNGGTPSSILQSIDLQVSAGEFISIIGPSGSGKSTLLNILGLLDEASAGDYYFLGENVNRLSGGKRALFRNQKIGFVFQSFMLIPRLTVHENVELPLLYTSIGRREREKRVYSALEQVGMLHKQKEPVTRLSGGQKQKAAIARAIINDPDLILADEPTGNLDQQSKMEVLEIFHQLHQRGKTIILVTHDLEVAERAGRVLTMKNGSWADANAWQKVGASK